MVFKTVLKLQYQGSFLIMFNTELRGKFQFNWIQKKFLNEIYLSFVIDSIQL